ncbi:MAG: hypothetical protein JNL83_22740 [Myxococcales bacterium]|nr:hypothetical protein [Myxococcales bacterium]
MTMPLSLREPRTELALELMLRFAERTGLSGRHAARRYLWTDAFAVCNFLGLARHTGQARYGALAAELVEQVHRVLGRHRADDTRTGWLSGLDEAAGALRPTVGGLRIGKDQPERAPGEPLDERREWDRDGQYFHYLTKWMFALERYARATSQEQPLAWARELANTAFHAFTRGKRMVWKLSIDLTRPLVDTMGQHDPLDGLVTCLELEAATRELHAPATPPLQGAIEAYAALLDRRSLLTADPLGLGSLLLDAYRVASVPAAPRELAPALLEAAATGVEFYAALRELALPAPRRLAFRELGLAIGFAAFAQLPAATRSDAREACAKLDRHARMREQIEAFWTRQDHRLGPWWTDHADINDVMLATSLVPDGVLG